MSFRAAQFEAAVAGRAALLWLLLRLTTAALLFAFAGANPVLLAPRASVIIATVAGYLSLLDTKRRNEDLLLANLGTSRVAVYTLCFGPPFAVELLTAIAGRL